MLTAAFLPPKIITSAFLYYGGWKAAAPQFDASKQPYKTKEPVGVTGSLVVVAGGGLEPPTFGL